MNKQPTPEALATLRTLTPPAQYAAIIDGMRGEEGDAFIEIIDRIHATWQAMPKTYESTAKGRAALAHLHYFIGGCDWWIVEKDADPDHAGQVQAFGIADLGMGAELGYISIPELLENGAELDLYYTDPKTIGELLA
ncbi:MAG TPA: hypothetical protein PLG22_15200 [Kiritimatiellia bacterium]|nr:hypothetical protein [Kiritimatiellia bacterium]